MRETTRWHRSVALFGAAAMFLAACGGDNGDGGDEGAADESDPIATDVGVTDEPCPDPVNEDNGCIYLGVLSDLTEGPFAPLGAVVQEGVLAFWDRVNDQGGIGGAYDVDVRTNTRDTAYDPQQHASEYRSIEPDILALATTFGTPPTEAILPDMDVDDVIAAPVGWWSGQHFEDQDQGLILESGTSYCLEPVIGLDHLTIEEGEDIGSLQIVHFPGDYGGDVAVGAELWAEANDVEFLGAVQTAPNAVVGTQDEAIGQVLSTDADVVVLAVGPTETGEIVGQASAQGFEGLYLGASPTWNPALLDSPAADALVAQFSHTAPWEGIDGESEAHDAIRESLDGDLPANDTYAYGWILAYPLLTALEEAHAAGDLTRAGLRDATQDMVVDYEGALPDRDFSLDGQEGASRTAVLSRPDQDAPLKLTTIATDIDSPTANALDYSEPCIVP